MSQIPAAAHVFTPAPGGGVDPGDVTLQLAYDGGNTIDEAADTPVVLNAATDSIALQITHDGSAPPAEAGVIDVSMDDDTGSWAALLVENAGAGATNTRLIRVFDAARATLLFEVTPTTLDFAVPKATVPYAHITFDGGKRGMVRVDREPGGEGNTVGDLKIGATAGGDEVDGGLVLEGATARIKVLPRALGVDIATDIQGAFGLPNVGGVSNALECDPPADGDMVCRLDEVTPPEVFRTKGFRAYREGAYGLVGRVYQQTFEAADLVAGVLTVDHSLDTLAPIERIYDNTGALVQPSLTLIPYQLADDGTGNASLVTFDPAVVAAMTGTWRITFLGV